MPDSVSFQTGAELRAACRAGIWTAQTSGQASGFVQTNLVILPTTEAAEFLQFCQRNPKPCPLLDVTEPGEVAPPFLAPSSDVRTDLPQYRVWRDGKLIAEPFDICEFWRDDLISFFLGCSFTFEAAMMRAGIPVRHVECNVNVPMFRTNMECRPAGRFRGPMVVSMRPLTPADAIRAVQISSRYPSVHGAPIHLGFPEQIGIADISRPDYGDAVPVEDNEIPVFWACGVTPQAVLQVARPAFAITHAPGCMFVSDVRDESLSVG
ncbi:MAG: putative hydro-lyase [Planctomycetaceae bacterium]